MFDTHTHLNTEALYPNRPEYMDRFVLQGGKGLVNIGINPQSNKAAIDIAQQSKILYPTLMVKATVGIHPCEVVDHVYHRIDLDLCRDQLQSLCDQYLQHIVAIGECGIDLHYSDSIDTLDDQQKFFDMQCQLAVLYGLPLVVHSRDAYIETMDVLVRYPHLRIVMHCRGYGPDEVRDCQDRLSNCWIGYTGTLTYPKAESVRQSFLITPRDKVVLETDAPYLAPQAMRGKQNEPSYLSYTYQQAASLRALSGEETQSQVRKNAHGLYGM